MSASSDLIMIFVALETTSIPLYILAAFNHDEAKSTESGMKYFLFGSFASAIMLYGFRSIVRLHWRNQSVCNRRVFGISTI